MLKIPPESLPEDTLDAVIESFVLREGTDYGEQEVSLRDKVLDVKRQVHSGRVILVYDEVLETVNLMSKEEFLRFQD